ncbi:hypothetical protein [Brevibacillus dissolubilis]|uniref:hypothetical protein n=1 Tax=Brevibacillus dissolubilis TaxID=1844116 RepID=UPI0011162E24|nr:hypothetical protein [Brevibacillus dissolubilis]
MHGISGMKPPQDDQAKAEVIGVKKKPRRTPRAVYTYGCMILTAAVVLSGCGNTARTQGTGQNGATVKSDPNVYFLQSDVPPRMDIQGNQTPYGTPANFGTGSDYGRFIRPDAVSDYTGVDFGVSQH